MSAYRQNAAKRAVMFCPRCNELLDQVDFGVDMCPRCEGFWIGNAVLELSGKQWPAGPQVWWRNALRCPECAVTATATVMNARASADVILDQCFAHGVWLDRGELARVLNDSAVFGKLREHLAALEPTEAQLLERRERWAEQQEERARLAEIERKRIEAERVKREAAALAERVKREAAAVEAEAAKRTQAEQAEQARVREMLEAAKRAHEAAKLAHEAANRGLEVGTPAAPPPTVEPRVLVEKPRDDAHQLQELARLVRERDSAQQRFDWLTARIDSLQYELATARTSVVHARSTLDEANKKLEIARSIRDAR